MESAIHFLVGDAKSQLVFCWNQSYCTDLGYKDHEKGSKPIFLKKLKKLWQKYKADLPWELGEYNESNTLLLDDSPCKPFTAVFPQSYKYTDKEDKSLDLEELRMYLEHIAKAENVQNCVRENPMGQQRITKSHPKWNFYQQVAEACLFPRESASNEDKDATGKDDRGDKLPHAKIQSETMPKCRDANAKDNNGGNQIPHYEIPSQVMPGQKRPKKRRLQQEIEGEPWPKRPR